ncbi:hypothetical protein POTOM_036173 [Populus tomentosa]|uniref:DUF659 domain-containing protein n=1 Tax=Populus tomentosa TaxID=118781 RepID=A0A8X7YVL2_POPTO|nr:hypothetical protein POTOM_036173 [Populus tomentosa]
MFIVLVCCESVITDYLGSPNALLISSHGTCDSAECNLLQEDAVECNVIISHRRLRCNVILNYRDSVTEMEALELVAKHGPGFKPPSYHDIREKYLKQEVDHTINLLKEYSLEWKKTGCSIMSDGWTDKKRRSICNFLVNSPKGTVFLSSVDTSNISKTADKVFEMLDAIVERIGEENVVQVVTDNAANYKAAGQLLMGKRKRLFWTPCAAHCIDLILEDFEKKLEVHQVTIANGRRITSYIYSRTILISMLRHFTKGKDLIRPAATRFATAYLTLGCLSDCKIQLMTMFTSIQWRSCRFSKIEEGKRIQSCVLDSKFWHDVTTCIKAAYPLIKVLRLVDSDEKPAMGIHLLSGCSIRSTTLKLQIQVACWFNVSELGTIIVVFLGSLPFLKVLSGSKDRTLKMQRRVFDVLAMGKTIYAFGIVYGVAIMLAVWAQAQCLCPLDHGICFYIHIPWSRDGCNVIYFDPSEEVLVWVFIHFPFELLSSTIKLDKSNTVT